MTKRRVLEITQELQRRFEDGFNDIGCFNGTFSLQVKLDSKPNQAHLKMHSICSTTDA